MLSAPGVESGEFLRSEIAQCAVRAHAVVIPAPRFDLAPRVRAFAATMGKAGTRRETTMLRVFAEPRDSAASLRYLSSAGDPPAPLIRIDALARSLRKSRFEGPVRVP